MSGIFGHGPTKKNTSPFLRQESVVVRQADVVVPAIEVRPLDRSGGAEPPCSMTNLATRRTLPRGDLPLVDVWDGCGTKNAPAALKDQKSKGAVSRQRLLLVYDQRVWSKPPLTGVGSNPSVIAANVRNATLRMSCLCSNSSTIS
jgi:hypothetical protein